jgi:hypothetical protein
LLEVRSETPLRDGESEVELSERVGVIHADLRIGADLTRALPLRANEGLCSPGVKLHGAGFIVTPDQAKTLGLGRVPGLERHIRHYVNGRDLTGHGRGVMVIDLFGLTEREVRQQFPDVYQWVSERIKPERDSKAGRTADANQYAREWWLFGKTRSDLRRALLGLDRYIVTVETAKHRVFIFVDASVLPDNRLVVFAIQAPALFGVLSSRPHVAWTLSRGGTLEDRPIYTKSLCFDPFPFPDCTEGEQVTIAAIAEELDALRKERLRLHPDLTLTGLYNVLAKLRSGEPLTAAEQGVHNRGLVGVLRRLHDDLDRAVLAAYGWPIDLGDDDLLGRLVSLNRERAEEEWRGEIHWLRPEFQAGIATGPMQRELEVAAATEAARQTWPKDLPEQFRAVRAALAAQRAPTRAEEVAAQFVRARRDRVAEVLETLVSLGQARQAGRGLYAA